MSGHNSILPYRLLDMAMETEHIVKGYERAQEPRLYDRGNGRSGGGAIACRCRSAVKFDRAKAEDVVKLDKRIDELESEIDQSS